MLPISSKRIHVAVLLLAFSGLGLHTASATELSGALSDPQGQVVPGATVRLLRRADASVRETRTDASGRFTFPDLNGGEYRITAESPDETDFRIFESETVSNGVSANSQPA